MHNILYITPYSQGPQAFLSAQPTSLLPELLGRSNQCGFETSRASHGHLRCNLNLVRLFCLSLPLPIFERLLLSSLTHTAVNPRSPSHTVFHQAERFSVAMLQSPVMPNTRQSSATQSFRPFLLLPPPGSRCPAILLGKPVVARAEQRPRPQQPPRAHGCFDTLPSRVRWTASF